jgi:hypothetical protein
MSNLPTNYVDDVLNADVNTRRKYQMIQNSDGTVSFNDVTDYDTVGSSIGAAQINAQNTKINQNSSAISTLNADLNDIKGGGLVPELDFANKVQLSTTTFTTSTKGCIILGHRNGDLLIDGSIIVQVPPNSWNDEAKQVINYIPAGATIALSASPGYGVSYFVPYKTN